MEQYRDTEEEAMKKGVCVSVALGTFIALCLILVSTAWAGLRYAREAAGREGAAVVPCGPSTAKSLAVSGGMRVFRVARQGEEGSSNVRVCSRSFGSSVGLGQKLVGAPFVIKAPWAGAVESRGVGQDSATVSVVGVDVLTRERMDCSVGGADRPGQLPKVEKLWSAGKGTLVAAVVRHLDPVGPEIVSCSGRKLGVLAQGEAIDLSSVGVRGSVVSWIEEGQRRAVRL
jgi:hypothetical protein